MKKMKKGMWAVVGFVVALILVSTTAAVLASAETWKNPSEYAEVEGQPNELRWRPLGTMRNPTCGANGPMGYASVHECIMEYLESIDLTEEQLDEVEAKLDEIAALQEEIRGKVAELREQGATREEIRAEIEPLMEEMKNLHAELVELLVSFGVDISTLREECAPPRPHRRGFRRPRH